MAEQDSKEEGGDAEGLPGGRIPVPPVPRDEWVTQVVDDPSSTVRPVLLQGYVGDAADEERTRIYLDASLATFVDIRNEDVLHHEELEGSHVPAGGRMVWVRGDAMVSRAPAAGAEFFAGPVLEQNRQPGAVGAQKAPEVQITLLTVAGCPTYQFWCPPGNTAATLCTVGGVTRIPCSAVDACPSALGCTSFQGCGHGPAVGPTGWQGCGDTVATVWTWGGICGIGPVSMHPGCPSPQIDAAGGGPIGQTGWQGCGQGAAVGPTGWQGCGQPPVMTLPGCAHGPATNFQGCGQPLPRTWLATCGIPPVSMYPPCPGAAGGDPIGQTGWQGCGQPGTAGPTGWVHCAHTLATVCTFHCEPPRTLGSPCGPGPVSMHPGCPGQADVAGGGPIGPTGWLGCGQPHISLPGCVHTGTCPQAEAVTGPGSTIATVCTQVGCPPHTQNCTIATVCTQIGCPPRTGFGCPRTSTCPPTQTPGCGAGIPTGQYGPQCPTFGFTCTYVHCPPPLTIVTQGLGCPSTSTCAPQGGAAGTVQAAAVTYHQGCPTFGFTCTQFC